MNTQINLSILAGQDGGLVVYELVDGEQTLAFGGDLEATTKYLNGRMAKVIVTAEQPSQRPVKLVQPRGGGLTKYDMDSDAPRGVGGGSPITGGLGA